MKKTSVFLLLFLGAALIASLAVSPYATRAADNLRFTLVYSGNVVGYMDSCG